MYIREQSLAASLGDAVRLLLAAGVDGQVSLVPRRVRRVRALVVLHVARAAERGGHVQEVIVALDLEAAAAGGDSRGGGAEGAGEGLKVAGG